MSWKLPLNQIGAGCTFTFGHYEYETNFRATPLQVSDHPWLQELLGGLHLSSERGDANFSMALSVEKQSDAYRVKAHLLMVPQLECVRSLTEFRTAIESENEALFIRSTPSAGGGEHQLSESEMEAYEHDGEGLMLSDFVTDVVLTSLPDFPLCQSDCRGLCSECGCNLNEARGCGRSDTGNDDSLSECPNIQYFQ